jgi:oxygen-dependent protoporphyrinogen oxidase
METPISRRHFISRTGQLCALGMGSNVLASTAAADQIASSVQFPTSLQLLNSSQKKPGGKSVVVVGAGIAGLSAAYLLQQSGLSVKVIESADFAGGRMSSLEFDGRVIDRGAQFFPKGFYATLVPLMEHLGLGPEFQTVLDDAAVVRNQKPHSINATNLFSVFRDGLLNLKDLDVGLGGIFNALNSLGRNPSDCDDWSALDKKSAFEFSRRLIGATGTEYLSETLLSGLAFQEPEESSEVLLLWILMFFVKAGKLNSFERGMGTVTEALARKLDVNLSTSVLSVDRQGSQLTVTTDKSTEIADFVILATPAPISHRILGNTQVSPATAKLLQSKYKPVLNIAVTTNRNWRDNPRYQNMTFMTIPRKERVLISSVTQDFRFNGQGAGEMFQIFCSPDSTSGLMEAPDQLILDAVSPEMERYFPGFGSSVSASHIVRWTHAAPIHYVGKSTDIAAYHRNQKAQPSNILLAGDFVGFYGTDGAARTGLLAAQKILTQLANKN